jgi:poly [ADP-ribose] polymerase 2/3/4
MPPRRKAPAQPLSNHTIAISGTFPGTSQLNIQNTILQLGANFPKSVTADTTILVSTEADVKKQSKKVQDAQASDIPIVSLDWLNEVSSQGKIVDTDDYLLTGAPPAANAKGKKRAASQSTTTAPAPKAAKIEAKAEPKVGEGSVLKGDVNIPLDEGCPHQTYRVYIDENGVVYDASLNQSNASHNNNKFYRVQVCYRPATSRQCILTR